MNAANIDSRGYAHFDCCNCGRHDSGKGPWRDCDACGGELVPTLAKHMNHYVDAQGNVHLVALGDWSIEPYRLERTHASVGGSRTRSLNTPS